MSLPLENPPPPPCPQGKPPPENETFLISPSYSKLFPIMKIFWPPPNFSNFRSLIYVNFYVPMQVSPDPRKNSATYGCII